MAFSVKDEATDAAVRRLARIKGKGLTETILEAVQNEFSREREAIPLPMRLERLAARYRKYPETGQQTDKAFFDALSGDL